MTLRQRIRGYITAKLIRPRVWLRSLRGSPF